MVIVAFTYHIELFATEGQALWDVKFFIDYVLGCAVYPQKQRQRVQYKAHRQDNFPGQRHFQSAIDKK